MIDTMMKQIGVFLIGILLLSGVFLWSGKAHAQSGDDAETEIRTMLEERDREIKQILGGREADFTDEQFERLKSLINGVIDFRAMGQKALGPHWEDLSTEQRDEFVEVFQNVVRLQSMSDLEVYNSEVSIDRIDVEGDSAFVRTTTTYRGSSAPVDYALREQGGEWFAEDIIVDRVSTAESYERSFRNVIRRHGFDRLMEVLEDRRAEAEEEAEVSP